MHTRHTCNGQKMFSTGAVIRMLGITLLCLGCLSLSVDRAAAGRRSVSTFGAGISGALILNELAKGTGKRKSATSQRSKSGVTARTNKPAKQRAKEKTFDADDSVAASKKEPAESTPVNDNISTGSTSPSQVKSIGGTGGAAIISASDEIKAAQQHLRFMGYDIPQETGVIDTKTKSAVMQFQDSIGAPVTGDLTTEQLQMLFMKVASKRDAP
jgi:peptidoglycan hydrolase-like protein with peptidoglycan-binding domain